MCNIFIQNIKGNVLLLHGGNKMKIDVKTLLTQQHHSYRQLRLKSLNAQLIVGRHRFNKNGNSFMELHSPPYSEVDAGVVEIKGKAICLYTHYSCGFGHCLNGIISAYSQYLQLGGEKPDFLLHFVNAPAHLKQLITLIHDIENIPLFLVYDSKSYQFENLTFFQHIFTPHPTSVHAVQKIVRYVREIKISSSPRNIAILKTTGVRKLDNNYNPRGNLNEKVISRVMTSVNMQLLDHSKLDVLALLKFIVHCDLYITSWGATTAWGIFLQPHQHCFCIVQRSYWHEVAKRQNLCFHSDLFANFTIMRTFVSNHLPPAEEAELRKQLTKWITSHSM